MPVSFAGAAVECLRTYAWMTSARFISLHPELRYMSS